MKKFFSKLKNFCVKNPIGAVLISLCFVTVLVSSILMAVLLPHSDLTKIEIVTLPDKTQYVEGQDVDTAGMVVKAYYGKSGKIITNYRLDKTQLSLGDTEVKVSYSDGGIIKSDTFDVQVTEKSLLSIEITKMPNKLEYIEGDYLNIDGVEVTAHFDNGKSQIIEGWEIDKKDRLKVEDTIVTVSYGGKTVSFSIEIEAKVLQSVYVMKMPYKLSYFEGEYFDFLGVEIYAKYANAQDELVKGWDYDKKDQLTVQDAAIEFSYDLHGIKKSVRIDISVERAPDIDKDEEFVQDVLELLPPIDSMSAENLPSINYAISLLDKLSQPTQEHIEIKQALEAKRIEISQSIPPEEKKVYSVSYRLGNGLIFEDIDFGNNPTEYTDSNGEIALSPAVSQLAVNQGYVFGGWLLDGQKIDKLLNLRSDAVLFADFQLTATVIVEFLDYYTDELLLEQTGVERTKAYDLQSSNLGNSIYSSCNEFPIAYFDADRKKISSADISIGKKVTVYAVTSKTRELHIDGNKGASVGWTFDFSVDGSYYQTSKMPQVGNMFVIPIGAIVKIVSMNANIDDILVDGVSKGEKINNTVVQAEFEMKEGEYASSVTFKTVLSDITTLSFLGYNQHSIVYPAGWDGVIASVDLDTLKFVYDEEGINYVNIYTIEGNEYYFDELVRYRFEGDTQIYVNRVRNSFSFAIYYVGGIERFDGLIGKQTLQDSLSSLSSEAMELTDKIFAESKLYVDAARTESISLDKLLGTIFRKDITVFSDWQPRESSEPNFEAVDYGECDFVNTWSALLSYDSDVLASQLTLTADGLYVYRTYINGVLSADINGIYRIENNKVVIKTLILNYSYQMIAKDDLKINIDFVQDGLLRATFIALQGRDMTVFEHTMNCGEIRPVNYTDKEFIGHYDFDGATVELRENGTAVFKYKDNSIVAFYRVSDDNRLYIFDNDKLGTGEIIGILEVVL